MRCRIKNISDPNGPSVTLGGVEVIPGETSGILELKEGSPDHQVAVDFCDQGLIEIILTQAGRRNRDSRLTGTGMGSVISEAEVKDFRRRNRKGRTSFGTRKNSHGIPGHPFGIQPVEAEGNAKVLTADQLGKKRPRPSRERTKTASIGPALGSGVGMPPLSPGSEVFDASSVVKKAEAPVEPTEPTEPVLSTEPPPPGPMMDPAPQPPVEPTEPTEPTEPVAPPPEEPVMDLEGMATSLAKHSVKDLKKVADALEVEYDKNVNKGPLVKSLAEDLVSAEPDFRSTFLQLLSGENGEVE